ncbi:MAG: bifunctional ADP-dependent NAD(P)H-hydrate dehydratase/NAD(P)H-hydrate epimerase [Candidatus Cloacimonadota bacterium]|nr:MAG: bifunctional ADP-dependent NAD(P)H-hydrate dehydratase/NAD(P)H-hydrate epimerase [Candidatus Cloacimonadota bacterium]
MHILSREEMYALDKYTIEKIGIPGKELMENAGKGCSEFIRKNLLQSESKIAIFCGSGNNGGDGFVIAKYLKKWGYSPTIFLVGNPEKMSPETLGNFNLCEDLNIEILHFQNLETWNDFNISLSYFDLIVDAIFGVGFKGVVRGWLAQLIEEINNSGKTVVAVDIASGIDANTGQAEIAVKADYTLTMAAYKYGHFIGKGREKSGFVQIIDIGIPKKLYRKFPPKASLVTEKTVKYPRRSPFAHKGEFGRVGIIAGSPGFTGAAIMASRAALRAGAGLITLFHPSTPELNIIFESQLLEVMTFAIPKNDENHIDYDKLWNKLSTMDVLLVGPGIGTAENTANFIETIFRNWTKPLVIDADAINIIAQHPKMLNLISEKPVLLTPHIGEFSRLINKNIEEILTNSIEEVEKFTKKHKCSILLKSSTSIFSDGKSLVFNISGNDGLATGGSGDVLSGIIISFLAQKLSIKDAAVAASFLMGKTAEKLAKFRKTASIIPSDIIENIFKN